MNERQQQLQLAAEIANRHDDLHPWEVAIMAVSRERKANYYAFLTGLLHDAVEDGYCSDEELAQFPSEVQDAVRTLTRQDGETYNDYLERVRNASSLARQVKLSDAEINLTRCQRSFGYESLEKRYRHVIEVLS
jgi:hypothetical protein